MKKLAVITVIMLLAVTAFGQQRSRERARSEKQDHKSEATVRRSAERSINSKTQRTEQVRRDNSRPAHTASQSSRSYSGERGPKPSGTSRTYESQNKRNHNGNLRSYESQGKRNPADKVRTYEGHGKHKPSGKVRAYEEQAEHRKNYTAEHRKHVRKPHAHPAHYKPVRYKHVHHHYRAPTHTHVIWTHDMYRDYRRWYPDFHYWYYPVGYRISTVPYYRAYFHVGEVRNVYGRVSEVWYSWSTDEYYLYFGARYPYQDFTVIVEGRDARRFSRHPEAYFGGRYIWVTGLVSTFEGKPEIMVKRRSQIHLY